MAGRRFTLSTVFDAVDRITGPTKTIFGRVGRQAGQANKAVARISGGFRVLRRFALAAGAAVTTGAIAKGIVSFAERGDEIAKTARMLGLGAEALQELRFAAERSGISTEQMNTGLRMLNNNLGQLKAEQGSLYSYLRRTNPELARQLRTAGDSEQAFMMLVEAIGEQETASGKAALAQAAFGRSGQEIIKMTAAGVDGLEALRAEARRYGDIITDDAAAGSERFIDALTNAKAALRGLRNQGLAPLLEKLTPVIQRFADWVAANRELIRQRIQEAFEKIGRALQNARPHLETARKVFAWMRDNMELVIAGILTLKAAQWGLNAAMAANPVGAVIASLVALAAVTLVIIRYWDEITAVLRKVWNAVNRVFNNPALRIAMALFAQPLQMILGTIQAIVDILSGRNVWQALANMTGPFKGILDAVGITKGSGRWNEPTRTTPVSPNAGIIESRSIERTLNEIFLRAEGLPERTRIDQRTKGRAPPVTVEAGRAFGPRAYREF